MRRALVSIGLAGLVAGCSATAHGPEQGAAITLAGTLRYPAAHSAVVTTGSLLAEAARAAAPKPKLLCDAPSLTYLIGRPHTEIPVPVDLSKRWVACSTCQASDARQPDRTDIIFNAQTGLVTDVTCG